MTRRNPDPISLVFGAGFVALGVVSIAGRIDLLADAQWVWPAVLVAVGIIMLARMAGGRRRQQAPPHQDTEGDQQTGSG